MKGRRVWNKQLKKTWGGQERRSTHDSGCGPDGHWRVGSLSADPVYSLTEGHLFLEVNAVRDQFCISFQVLNKDTDFVQEFVKVLTEEGIPYELGEMRESRLPQIKIGK